MNNEKNALDVHIHTYICEGKATPFAELTLVLPPDLSVTYSIRTVSTNKTIYYIREYIED